MSPTRNRGELEAAIMNVLWDSPRPLTAQQVRSNVGNPRPAITTVVTVLERLRAKGHVSRESVAGQSHTFAPSLTRDEDIAKTMTAALSSTTDRAMALMRFAGALSEADRDFLRRAIESS